MTEGNTTITLHNDSIDILDKLLTAHIGLEDTDEGLNVYGDALDDLKMIRGTMRAQYHPDRQETATPGVIALVGLPGAGKTFAGNKLAELLECPTVSMGDTVREKYEVEFGEPPERGEDIRTWVEDLREENEHLIPEWTVDAITRDHREADVVVVDGLRTEADLQVLADAFDPFHLIEVKAPFLTRLERLQDRGREGEDEYTAYDLVDRDRQEMGWGVQQVIEDGYADISVVNDGSAQFLSSILMEVVENNLPYDVPGYLDRRNVSGNTKTSAV